MYHWHRIAFPVLSETTTTIVNLPGLFFEKKVFEFVSKLDVGKFQNSHQTIKTFQSTMYIVNDVDAIKSSS